MTARLWQRLRSILAIVVIALLVLRDPVAVYAASTTGTLTGTVVDRATNKPLYNATVSADSPAQSETVSTDNTGHFTFIQLLPDAYTITIRARGYTDERVLNIAIQPDTLQTTVAQLDAVALQEIGHVHAHSSSDIVQSGITSDVTALNPTQQQAAAMLGGGTRQENLLSSIASVPGVFVPIGPSTLEPPVLIRGGSQGQVGYEVDGVPLGLNYAALTPPSGLSSLGAQTVQVYTGAAPTDQQSQGIGGYVNEVIKTGTYPGFTNIDFGVGAPAENTAVKLEIGGADGPAKNFTYYVGISGTQMQQRLFDQYNGTGLASANAPLTSIIASGCGTANPSAGCYQNGYYSTQQGYAPLGPNGFVNSPTFWGTIPSEDENDSVVNLHFSVPHHKDKKKDDIQFLVDQSSYQFQTNDSLNDFGSATNDVENGTVTQSNGNVISGCQYDNNYNMIYAGGAGCTLTGGVQPYYLDQPLYGGSINSALSAANLNNVNISPFPGHTDGNVAEAISPSQGSLITKNYSLAKIAYTHEFSDDLYGRLSLYSSYSNEYQNSPVSPFVPYDSTYSEPNYSQESFTKGFDASLTDHLSDHHLLNLDIGQTAEKVSVISNQYSLTGQSSPVAVLVNANNPLAGCYAQDPNSGNLSFADCSTANSQSAALPAASYVLPSITSGSTQLVPGINSPTVDTVGALTCGTGPCEYLTVSNGQNSEISNVGSRFSNISLNDRWQITHNLLADIGMRYDNFHYQTALNTSPAEQLYLNSFNATHCISGNDIEALSAGQACSDIGAGYSPTAETASTGNLNFSDLEPRISAAWTLDPHNVIRGSIGRYVQAAPAAEEQFATGQPSIPSSSLYGALGYQSFNVPLSPESSENIDISWEHSSQDNMNSMKVTPFLRKTKNEFSYMPVDAANNVYAAVNGLNRDTKGLELLWRHGDFAKNGFAAQLAYTYTHSTATYPTLANGSSFVSTINSALIKYNGYTSYCAQNPSSSLCPSGGSVAAPCYTAATGSGGVLYSNGVGSSTCSTGMISNPYWNAAPAQLLDPNASYPVYETPVGTGINGNADSSQVPHVASLILNWRHNRWAITPTMQFEAGAQYGSPLTAQGVAPDSCSATLASSTTNDPRYVNGVATGTTASPYDASSCYTTVTIPDPATGQFDAVGAFRQPSLFALNIATTYQMSPAATINFGIANLVMQCFGGSKTAWAQAGVCNYRQGSSFVGNFYNPGDAIQPAVEYPYVAEDVSEFYAETAGARLPIELTLAVHFKL